MLLSAQTKTTLANNATALYQAYVALDFFKTKAIGARNNVKDITLLELCSNTINSKNLNQQIQLDGKNYDLKLTFDVATQSYTVQLNRPLRNLLPELKVIADYTDENVVDLLAIHHFKLHPTDNNGLAASVWLENGKHHIGGPGKLDIYRTHLITLFNIIDKIKKEDDLSAMLIALATGTGKTFVQALWLHVLHISELMGVFAMPDELVAQFCADMRRLLPDELVDNIAQLHNETPYTGAWQGNHIVVASSQALLDNHYQSLLQASPDQLFLSFDEQHLIMKEERQKVRLTVLSQQFLCLFLTATPTEETYKLAGSRPVAIMSSKQKQQAGQGKLAAIQNGQVTFLNELNKKHSKDMWSYIKYGTTIRALNIFMPEISSAASKAVEQLPHYFNYDKKEESDRWALDVPMARKALWIIDDNEALVNVLRNARSPKFFFNEVYHEGNLVMDGPSFPINSIFSTRPIDGFIATEHNAIQRSQCDHLPQSAKELLQPVRERHFKQQLHSNMFHYLLEYVLMDLTGLTQIEQNQQRKISAQAFSNQVKDKIVLRSQTYYQEKLSSKIDTTSAEEISHLLATISQYLNDNIDNEILLNITDNWFLDNTIQDDFNQMLEKNIYTRNNNDYYNRSIQFDDYFEKYQTLAVMAGMSTAETPIEDSIPFFHMDQETKSAYEEGKLSQNAKSSRKRSAIETLAGMLGGYVPETHFTPQHVPSMTEDQADNLFKLGFVGMYISNKKHKGFNDPNLHTVVNVTEHTLDDNNSPDVLIQSIGRNRGLDPTVTPAYLHMLGHNLQTSFNLDVLTQKDDYYPEYFKAQNQFNSDYVEHSGEQLAQDIIRAYYQAKNADDSIDAPVLKRRVLKLIAQSLRDINAKNNFNVAQGRAQLARAVAKASEVLDAEIQHIQTPYSLSPLFKPFSFAFKSILSLYNMRENRALAKKFTDYAKPATDTLAHAADQVYLKLINQTKLDKVATQLLTTMELTTWGKSKIDRIKTTLISSVSEYVKQDLLQEIRDHAPLSPQTFEDIASIMPLLDTNKIAELAIKEITPILFHPECIATAELLVGTLTKEDLIVLIGLSSQHEDAENPLSIKDAPEKVAEQLFTFIDILRTKDSTRLKNEFLTLPNITLPNKPMANYTTAEQMEMQTQMTAYHNQIMANPLYKIFPVYMLLIHETQSAYCHYHQHDLKGQPLTRDEQSLSTESSPLLNSISPALKDIKMPYRKIEIYANIFHGTLNAIPKNAQISGDSNAHVTSELKRIKTHILRPVWWQLSVSKLSYNFVSGAKALFKAIKDLGLSLWNGLKTFVQWIANDTSNLESEADIEINSAYEEAAINCTKKINKLRPLTPVDALKVDCVEDMIKPLENHIDGAFEEEEEEERQYTFGCF